jgi:hypothetical protein
MSTARYAKERQFVIFLSDGEPSSSVIDIAQDDFVSGENMPTTFSVYFTSTNRVPASIEDMTENIKANDYSTSNKNSGLWAIQTNHDALLNLLMSEAMKSIIIPGNPSRMVINGIASISSSDTSFDFQNRFALTNVNTNFVAEIIYEYTNPDKSVKDSVVKLNFVVKRKKDAPIPADIRTICWEQPTLQFYYNNSPISEATEDMKELQIRLFPNGETMTAAKVELKSSLESMPVTLSKNGSHWEKTFPRATQSSAVNDDILQHIPADSLIAIYRNPTLPLDTVRIAIPVRLNPKAIPVTAILRDTSGNGYIDRIDLAWAADTFDIINNLPSAAAFVLNSQITTSDGTVIKLTPETVFKRKGDTLSIVVKENSGKILQTVWNSAIVQISDSPVTEQGNAFYVDKIVDGTGPVIQRVLYYPGTGSKPLDTLKVTLSEPLNCDPLNKSSPSSAFNYFDAGKLEQGIFTGASFIINCESGFVTEVRIILNSNGVVTPDEDSMRIFGNSNSVVDKSGNKSVPNNRILPVEWGIENNINIVLFNNPLKPGKTEINPVVRQQYGVADEHKTGTIIGITSIKSLEKRSDGSFGSAAIYDAVGNLVQKNLPVQKNKTGSHYYAFWDGRNKNNRAVGTGTYLMILVGSTDGTKFTEKMKIGVTR